jgi:putative membrane protein
MSSELPDPDAANDQPGFHANPSPEAASTPNPFLNEIENPEPVTAEVADPMANLDADQLSFLHPTSLVFDLIAHGKTYLVPAAFGLWGAAKGDMTLLIISALIFVPAFLTSVFRYFTFRYCISDDKLIVRHGLIFRNVRTVPVARIQNIDFVQNPLHRILRVAEVKVETASGTKPEATLRVLSMAQMESLRNAVFERATPVTSVVPNQTGLIGNQPSDFEAQTNSSSLNIPSTTKAIEESILEIPLTWLIKAGLTSNRGMIMVGVLMGIYFQFGERRAFFRFDWLRDLWPAEVSVSFVILSSIIGLTVAFLFLRLFGVGWFVLRFFGYKLIKRGDDLRISCGLFTKVSATVPRQRVQFISIHRNLIMRWMGLASIRIETAGGAGKESENATESVSKRWFVPVIPENRIVELVELLKPGLQWNESKLTFQPLAPRTKGRLCRLAIVQSLILAAIGIAITRPWGWLAGVIALPLLIMWAIKKSKSMRYSRTDSGVVYRSGVFNRKTSMTFFEKIQTLRVDQSPFDRRWGMARLSVDTAASGPAEHRIEVRYLDETFARHELQFLREKTGKEQPVFG